MGSIRYVPFEPGIGASMDMRPKALTVRSVHRVPSVGAVGDEASLQWFDDAEVENLLHLQTLAPGNPPTRVAVMKDAARLFVAFHCAEPEMSKAHRLVPREAADGSVEVFPGMKRTLVHDECVALFLESEHEKSGFLLMLMNINGARLASRVSSAMGWTVFPSNSSLGAGRDLEGLDWECEVFEAGDHWRAAFSVGMTGLAGALRSRPTFGVNFGRYRNVDLWRHYSWAPVVHLGQVPALAMGDAYFCAGPVKVEAIDWGTLDYGDNCVRVFLRGGGKDADVVLKVRVLDAEREEETAYSAETESGPVTVPKRDEAQALADFHLPVDYYNVLVVLEVAPVGGGEPFYRATFPLGNHGGLRIQPYARTRPKAGEAPQDPDPSDPDFHQKKRDHLLSKLPRFRRRNTTDGASSDFVLSATDGSVEFDLMKPGALQRMADWVASLFDRDCDRIAAVALLTNDDWVTSHAAPRVPMQTHLTALSHLRLGSGHCFSRACVGAGIVSALDDPRTGKPHRANAVLVMGHVVVAVERGDDYVMVDPSFGHFFFNSDNTDLATARELAAQPELVARVVKQPKRRLLNYACIPAQIRLEEGTVVWPAGAPPA